MDDPQTRFISLLVDISRLQWVREALSVQQKQYQGLRQQQEREEHLKNLLEKQILEYRNKQDASFGLLTLKRHGHDSSYTDTIERLCKCEQKLQDLTAQCNGALNRLQDLRLTKHTLDTHCLDLHTLYDEIVPRIPDDPSHLIEQHLKAEVTQLANDIPLIEKDIHCHSTAQKKLYKARDMMESAMMTLPGASLFLDRHAGHRSTSHSALFPSSLKDAEKLAFEAYRLELDASKLCKDVPLIPSSTFNRDDNVVTVLTAYRGYRLKIETILRKVNPQLLKLQHHLTVTRHLYETKTMDWIDQQIIMLEQWLRSNGGLENVNLDRLQATDNPLSLLHDDSLPHYSSCHHDPLYELSQPPAYFG